MTRRTHNTEFTETAGLYTCTMQLYHITQAILLLKHQYQETLALYPTLFGHTRGYCKTMFFFAFIAAILKFFPSLIRLKTCCLRFSRMKTWWDRMHSCYGGDCLEIIAFDTSIYRKIILLCVKLWPLMLSLCNILRYHL